MIRYSLLTLFVVGVVAYSWKDWFRALCVFIVLVAVLERPDMPAAMLGINGLNPFNLGLAGILLARAYAPSLQRREWDAPRWFNLMLWLSLVVIVIGFLRLYFDPSDLVVPSELNRTPYTTLGLVNEFLFNTIKWVVPGLLFFEGCRSRERHQWAVLSLVALYVALALQTIKLMPLPFLLDGAELEKRAVRVLSRDIGYHRVELAGVLAGASWAMFAARPLFARTWVRLGLLSSSAVTALALALTAGRVGYGAWCVIGFMLASLRWRRLLFAGPIAVALLIGFAPGVSQRLLEGISFDKHGERLTSQNPDLYTVTAGRSVLWPYVLASIAERPVVGYGREAMSRNGVREKVFEDTGEDFGHPHNGYLQFALDNGLFGLTVLLSFFGVLLVKSARMFRHPDGQIAAAGGMALSLIAAILIAAVGAQTFYPTELALGVWCSIGLLIRLSLQSSEATDVVAKTAQTDSMPAFPRVRWAVVRPVPSAVLSREPRRFRWAAHATITQPRRRLLPASPPGKWRAKQ